MFLMCMFLFLCGLLNSLICLFICCIVYFRCHTTKQMKGCVKEPNKFHMYETEKITRKASVTQQNILSCLVLPPEIIMHDAFNVIL